MIHLHLHSGKAIQISKEMFFYIYENLKIDGIKKIVYTNTFTNKIYCIIPNMQYACVTFSPLTPDAIIDFSNITPKNFFY